MRVIIFHKNKGQSPTIYAEGITLKTAKEKLSALYMQAVSEIFDSLNENDGISADRKELNIADNYYFIEKDTRL